MKDDDFHRTKAKPNEKLLLLKLKKEKLMLNTCYSRNYADSTGKGYFSQPFFESVAFMDGVACGDAVFSAIEMNLSSEQNNNRNIGTGWQ